MIVWMFAFLFENKPGSCTFGHELWPGKAQVSWTPCTREPAREDAARDRGMGHVCVACNSCHDQLRQTVFFEPAHDRGHRPLTSWVTGPIPSVLSASATTVRATATAEGRSAAATLTTQIISLAVCAPTTLTFLLEAAWLAATANAAGSGWWPSSLATRTVTSCRLGGSFMSSNVSEVSDISRALIEPAEDLANECLSGVFAFRSTERSEVANVISLLGVAPWDEHKALLRAQEEPGTAISGVERLADQQALTWQQPNLALPR